MLILWHVLEQFKDSKGAQCGNLQTTVASSGLTQDFCPYPEAEPRAFSPCLSYAISVSVSGLLLHEPGACSRGSCSTGWTHLSCDVAYLQFCLWLCLLMHLHFAMSQTDALFSFVAGNVGNVLCLLQPNTRS